MGKFSTWYYMWMVLVGRKQIVLLSDYIKQLQEIAKKQKDSIEIKVRHYKCGTSHLEDIIRTYAADGGETEDNVVVVECD